MFGKPNQTLTTLALRRILRKVPAILKDNLEDYLLRRLDSSRRSFSDFVWCNPVTTLVFDARWS